LEVLLLEESIEIVHQIDSLRASPGKQKLLNE
jgi:hypothetical protein